MALFGKLNVAFAQATRQYGSRVLAYASKPAYSRLYSKGSNEEYSYWNVHELAMASKQQRNMAYYDTGPFSGDLKQDSAGKLVTNAVTYELERSQREAAEEIVPWFFDNMPSSYFKHIKRDDINRHLRAMSALQVAGQDSMPSLTLLGDDKVTYIHREDRKGLLADFIEDVQKNRVGKTPVPMQALKAFSSQDNRVVMDIFDFKRVAFDGKTTEQELGKKRIFNYCKKLMDGEFDDKFGHASKSSMFEEHALEEYFKLCTADYIAISDPRRFCLQRQLYEELKGTEKVKIAVDEGTQWGEDSLMVTVGATNMLPDRLLLAVTSHLAALGINIIRAHVDVIMEESEKEILYDQPREMVVMTRLLLNKVQCLPVFNCGTQYSVEDMITGLSRVKWVDPFVTHLFKTHMKELGVNCLMTAEIISAIVNASRGPLTKIDRFAFPGARLQEMVMDIENLPFAVEIANLLIDRFNPENPMDEDEFLQRIEDVKENIRKNAADERVMTMLHYMADFVANVHATNLYNKDRFSLSMKLNPAIMHAVPGDDRPIPYGVYYVHGRRFDGFHVRFRDIARGGLRMVTPNIRAYEGESCRHYDENYNLATAQQLKNKDIPEGGSKAVVLIRPSQTVEPDILTRKSVKGFVDGMLDLIGNDDVQNLIIHRGGKKDTLYLGPDEKIIPEDIAWMTKRAKDRNYFNHNVFISSKAENGINHKEFGVTSEGVNVFMEVALKRVGGIDPKKQPFTVKLTGGPDGDVCGNMIKIMHREYGDNVKIVGIADGEGCAEDPNGLNMQELLQLVEDEKTIKHYNPDLVDNVNSFVYDASTTEGATARNTMHNRVEADAFVPAGGRPDTIGAANWKSFLKSDGTPSSRVVTEGANLFLTPAAREGLFKSGAFVVKDSSANKCGVVVSSYEIMAAFLMDGNEFKDHKVAIVEDVQARIKELARLEAELLFDEYEKDPSCSLPDLSLRISNAIIKVSDAVFDAINDMDMTDPQFEHVLSDHLPPTIRNLAFDRFHEKVPEEYTKNIISKRLATTLVYNEGLAFVEGNNSDQQLAQIALGYSDAKDKLESLLHQIESDDIDQADWKDAVVNLLKKSTPRMFL